MLCDTSADNFVLDEILELQEFIEIEEEEGISDQEMLPNVEEDAQEADTATGEGDYLVVEEETTTTSQEESCPSDGFSIVDMCHVITQMKEIGMHGELLGCSTASLVIIKIERFGLRTTVQLECKMCNCTFQVHSQPEGSRREPGIDINLCAVAGTMTTGGGYAQMEGFLSAVNVPCMSKREYRKNHDMIVNKSKFLAEETMSAAAEEEKRLAIARKDVLPGGMPHIPVVADGSWMKRSYRSGKYDSMSGVGVIIGYHTKKVLFAGVKNRMCCICLNAAKQDKEARPHQCFKNWGRNQTSTRMESDAITEGFRSSKEKYGLIYSTLIADGDSSVYKSILECNPYGTVTRVKKIECTNHLLRNICNKLKDVAKKTEAGYYRKAVENSVRRIRAGIQKAAKHRMNENVPLEEKVKNLYQDIINVPSHVFGEHSQCSRIRYFCDGTAKEGETNLVPDLSSKGVYTKIQELIQRLAAHSESLLYQTNNNTVESFNGIIAKHTGGKRLNFGLRGSYSSRVYAAVIHYNSKDVLSRLTTSCGGAHSQVLKNMEERRKKASLKNAEKKRGKKSSQQFRAVKDSDYGPNAQRPDMDEAMYQLQKTTHMDTIKGWSQKREEIERETVGQSDNNRWLFYKAKLLTASNFGRVCKRLRTTLCGKLIKELIYKENLNVRAVKYGQAHEPIALEELSRKENVNIQKCGLFIDASIPYLGASPDGLIDDDGIVEVKCPISAENVTPEEALQTVETVKEIFTDSTGREMRRAHSYFYQVQGQLHITGRQYCLFGLWTKKGMLTLRIQRDDDFWEQQMEQKLSRFYLDCMLPELVDGRKARNMDPREPQYILDAREAAAKRKVEAAQRRGRPRKTVRRREPAA